MTKGAPATGPTPAFHRRKSKYPGFLAVLAAAMAAALIMSAFASSAEPGWIIIKTGADRSLLSVFFIDASTGWIAGENGLVLRSDDGGFHWARQTTGVPTALQAIFFLDRNRGWAVGNLGAVICTDDGGRHWTKENAGTRKNLYAVQFAGAETGWAAGQDGIWKTTDGGKSWRDVFAGQTSFESLFFEDEKTGCVAGEFGEILTTADAGRTWTSHRSEITTYFEGIWPADAAHWWAVGLGTGPGGAASGVIYGSTDGGQSWSRRAEGFAYLNDVSFADPGHGWAVGEKGTILATTDGGANWRPQDTGQTRHFFGVHFLDAQRGWAVGAGGLLALTRNGGAGPGR
jgi:photosystem II stability/assembly factor-like uncharacterized protein